MLARLKAWVERKAKSQNASASTSDSLIKPNIPNCNSNSNSPKIGNYHRLRVIGEGRYGAVYKARNYKTGECFALKKIFMDYDEDGIPSTTIREIALLKQMEHPNIVKLHETFFHSNNSNNSYDTDIDNSCNSDFPDLYLVLDLLSCDLKKFLDKQQQNGDLLNMNILQNIFKQILIGIEYCHSHNILHRDLKPQNILINTKTFLIKLTDFGLSRCYVLPNKTWTHEIVTLWYRPPEVLLGCKSYQFMLIYGRLDVYFEMINNNKPLFRGQSEISQLMEIFIRCGTPNFDKNNPHNLWPTIDIDTKHFDYIRYPKWKRKSMAKFIIKSQFKQCTKYKLDDLLNRFLSIDPIKRITTTKALKHPFFNYHIDG